MECGGSARASRIPVEFVANSVSGCRDKQLDEDERRQLRYHHYQQLQQSRDNHTSSSVNSRVISPPPPQPSLSGSTSGSVETVVHEWDSSPRSRRENVTAALPSNGRHRRARQRVRPIDERPPRPRAESDSRRTPESGVEHSSRLDQNHQMTPSDRGIGDGDGGGRGYSSGDDSGDDVMSRACSTSTRSPGPTVTTDNHPSDILWQKRRTNGL